MSAEKTVFAGVFAAAIGMILISRRSKKNSTQV